ncbi:MAG: hypothetical protein AAFP03_04560 [Cyanobacteria bacterium J06598_3]
MIKTIARHLLGRLIVGASTFCFIPLLATAAQAQANPSHAMSDSAAIAAWQPLEARTFVIEEDVSLDHVSDSINSRLSGEETVATKSVGIDIESLPLVSEFLDEDGNFDLGLPFSVDISDLMGESYFMVGTDFSL